MIALALGRPLIVAMQSASEFSRSMERHAMASHHSAQEVALVVLGVIAVAVTTGYALLLVVRPGETAADHVKRRVLDDDRREPR